MKFSRAVAYPFTNLAKLFSIVLAMTIAIAIFLGLIANSYDWTPLVAMINGINLDANHADSFQPFGWTTFFGVLGLLVVAVVSGFWLSGYSVETIRSVMNGNESLPDVNFGQNAKDGFCLFISSVAYWILLGVLCLVLFTLLALTGSTNGMNPIVLLASMIVMIAAFAIMGWAYFIGMARFAASGDCKTSWQVLRNMRLARENWRGGFTLLLYMIALTIINGVVRGLVEGILGGLIGAFSMASITVSIIVYYIFNLMQHFSTQHLVAQFAGEIGIRSDYYDPEKEKHGAF